MLQNVAYRPTVYRSGGSTKPASQKEAVDASASSPHPLGRARSREKGNATVCRDLLAHCAAQIDCIFCGFAHTLSSGKSTAAGRPARPVGRHCQARLGQARADLEPAGRMLLFGTEGQRVILESQPRNNNDYYWRTGLHSILDKY